MARSPGVDSRPENIRAVCRSQPETPRHRSYRPVLPAPRRPVGADRGHRRRDGRDWCRPARCASSACPKPAPARLRAPMPSTRSARCKANGRCGNAVWRTRSRRFVPNSASASCPISPLGRGFLTGTQPRAEDLPDSDYRAHDPRYQGANYDANMAAVARGQGRRCRAWRHGSAGGAGLAARQGTDGRADPGVETTGDARRQCRRRRR